MTIETCRLWTDPASVLADDLNLRFERVETYTQGSNHWRYLLKCRDCGQLYFYEFFEQAGEAGGCDPMYTTYIPVGSRAAAEAVNETEPAGLLSVLPRLQADWPLDTEHRVIRWIGRDAVAGLA